MSKKPPIGIIPKHIYETNVIERRISEPAKLFDDVEHSKSCIVVTASKELKNG